MTGILEDFFLRSCGATDQQIAALNAALPDLAKAIALVKPHLPLIIALGQMVIAKEQELK